MKKLILIAIVIPFFGFSQPLNIKKTPGGIVSLGMRTTVSTFNGGELANTGMGVGGQFRVQFSNRLNTDWYFDYITGKVGDYASRTDYHIGWSVLFYLTEKHDAKLRPYILAGHCFDHTEQYENANLSNTISKGSSAVQAGAGVHLNITERLDLSLVSQYMMHLGTDVHAHQEETGEVRFELQKGAGLEGHLLFHVGINYKIGDLW